MRNGSMNGENDPEVPSEVALIGWKETQTARLTRSGRAHHRERVIMGRMTAVVGPLAARRSTLRLQSSFDQHPHYSKSWLRNVGIFTN